MSTNPNVAQMMKFDANLSISGASISATPAAIGTLTNYPSVITFQNDTNQTVFLDDDGTGTNGKYFVSGERLVVDCQANRGTALSRTWPIGTTFYASGTMGTGTFSIAVIYAK